MTSYLNDTGRFLFLLVAENSKKTDKYDGIFGGVAESPFSTKLFSFS